MFFEEIKIKYDDFQHLVATSASGTEEYINRYISRKFYIGDTVINRKTLKDWEKAGLLPYEYKDKGWRKFSFVEWVWLESINEFRKLGVSIDKIKEVKEVLFTVDPDEWIQAIKKDLEASPGAMDEKEKYIAAINNRVMVELMKDQFIQNQISTFLLLVVGVVTTDQNYCLVYNHDFILM